MSDDQKDPRTPEEALLDTAVLWADGFPGVSRNLLHDDEPDVRRQKDYAMLHAVQEYLDWKHRDD